MHSHTVPQSGSTKQRVGCREGLTLHSSTSRYFLANAQIIRTDSTPFYLTGKKSRCAEVLNVPEEHTMTGFGVDLLKYLSKYIYGNKSRLVAQVCWGR